MAISNYRILFEAVLNDTQLKAGVNRLISSNSQLQKSFATVNKNAKGTANATAQATTSMNHSANNMGKGLKGFAGQWVNITKKVLAFGAATSVIRGAAGLVGKMVDNVLELDKALVELSKVSNLSGDNLKDFTEKSFEAGKTVGRTGTEMISAATEFAKAGYGEEKIVELARIASMYQNIADTEISASQAAGTIIAMTKAFSNEGLTAIQTIDKINEVSNKFAVSSADIATALPKVASTLSLAGNSSSEAIGLLVAATELMPNQASRVARGMRSITLNLQGMTAEGEKSVTLTAKMEKSFNDIGMTLTDKTTGGLKSTYDILKELSGKWKDLTPDQQKYYAALIGGKQQVDVVAATLKNFSAATGATETAINSAGSAAQENEKYMKGIEGRIAGFNTEFQKLSAQLINSDFIKGTVSFGTGLLQILTASDALIPKVVLLTATIWGVSAAFTFLKTAAVIPTIGKITKSVNNLSFAFQAVKGGAATVGEALSFAGMSPLLPWIALAGAIVGTVIALNKIYPNLEANRKKIIENADAIQKYKDKIASLEKKKEEHGALTAAEKNRLELYKLELEILEKENKEIQKKADSQFKAEHKSTTTDISGKTTTTLESDKVVKTYIDGINLVSNTQKKADELHEKASKETNKKKKQAYKDEETELRRQAKKEADISEQNKLAVRELLNEYNTYWEGREDKMSAEDKAQVDLLNSYATAFDLIDAHGKDAKASLAGLGEAFGVIVDEAGNISSVDLTALVTGLEDAGANKEDISAIVASLKEGGDVKFTGTNESISATLTALGYTSDEIQVVLDQLNLVGAAVVKPKIDESSIKGAQGTLERFWSTLVNGIKTGRQRGKAKGTPSDQGGVVEVNEEGFEFIRSKQGVRVANGGARGLTRLRTGDEVITHEKSVAMLRGDDDVNIKGYATGTPISWAQPSKGKFSKESAKGFDTASTKLDYYRSMGYISEQEYYQKLMDLRSQYYKAGKISLADYRKVNEQVHDYNEKLAEEALENEIKRLETLEKQYSAHQELLNKYAEKQVDNIDIKIEGYEKEKEQLEKQNEASEKSNALMEAQNKLVEAKSRKVKLYRAGVGFGYESDISAVSEAQKELDVLKAQYALEDKILAIDEKIALAEQEKAKWSAVTSTWQDEQDILNLEQVAGTTISAISSSINGSLATFDSVYSNIGANLEGIIDAISQTEGSKSIQSAGTIANLTNANKHATGTSSARGGLSLVGEQGAELRVLGQGDGIMPNNITKNLMDIGRFNAKELINASNSIGATASNNQTSFNFGAGSIVVNGDNAESLAKDIINNMNRIVQQNGKQRS